MQLILKQPARKGRVKEKPVVATEGTGEIEDIVTAMTAETAIIGIIEIIQEEILREEAVFSGKIVDKQY
jgi:hypothetical protein